MTRKYRRILRRLAAVAILAALSLAGPLPEANLRAQPAQSANQEPPMPDISKLHGKELVENACGDCHGVDGNSEEPETPKLAGQKASYLRMEMLAFKSGARHGQGMDDPRFIAITDAQVDELAEYYSRLPVIPDKVKDLEAAKLGAFIFANGRPGVPPCAVCHGPHTQGGMMGGGMMMMRVNPADVPNLNGQHAAYTLAQMNAFASGGRPSQAMGRFAADLSERDRQAVADYLAGLR